MAISWRSNSKLGDATHFSVGLKSPVRNAEQRYSERILRIRRYRESNPTTQSTLLGRLPASTSQENHMRPNPVFLAAALAALVAAALSQTQKAPPAPPAVTGDWKGSWGLYSPPVPEKEGEAKPKPSFPAIHFQMDCKVEKVSEG